MTENSQRISISRIIVYIVSYLFVVIWLLPLLWMVFTSLKPAGSAVTVLTELISPPFTWANFEFVTSNASVWRWTWNSTVIAVITTAGTLAMTSLAAFALSRLRFRGKTFVFWLIIGGLMVPTEATIIPLFQMMIDNGLVNSYSSIILPSLAAPLGVMILKQFYDGIPNELVEAAKIDGAGLIRIYASIFVPLSRSSMAALAIFTFISSWNNFLWPFLAISDENMMTLPIGIPLFQGTYQIELTIPMAANVLASFPAILVFIIFQKHIIKGITMTGIKG
ncbi:carbohydrate ABC transporter permease [Paenibacillus piri]|uniref:Carbohydrate ABC transporter permease n=1 Tax=Paenibacillus piri TaxID=2547395 RepID=A0A4R5KIQ8_9BACL|nr:carbohydrate ABC transporter permease [Paenibacillus piri]TDF94170.1 carbohydrate ABC transporter permease [Paenibacillus piri]